MPNTTLSVKNSAGAAQSLSGVEDAGNSSAIVTKHLPVDSDGTVLFTEAAASADAVANPTLGSIQGLAKVFNGTTWDRARSGTSDDGVADATHILGSLKAITKVFNATTWDRLRSALTGDAVSEANAILGSIKTVNKIFNGTTWDRLRSAPGTVGVLAANNEGTKATYATGATQITPDATPTDVVEIVGSATKTVRIKKIIFQGNATTAKQWPVQIIRRAEAITDGTAVVPVVTQFDTGDDAPTAVVNHYTGDPTPKAASPASSVLFATDVTFTAPATAAAPLVLDFSRNQDKPIILRGAADCLVINLGGGALVAGEKFSYSVEWEEDAS